LLKTESSFWRSGELCRVDPPRLSCGDGRRITGGPDEREVEPDGESFVRVSLDREGLRLADASGRESLSAGVCVRRSDDEDELPGFIGGRSNGGGSGLRFAD
jgi:hypothetical protein